MGVKDGNFYIPMTNADSQELLLDSIERLSSDGIPPTILDPIMQAIEASLKSREQDGIPVDTRSREEVRGVVFAAMGGNDHLRSAQMSLNAYVVGLANSRNPWTDNDTTLMEAMK